MSGYFVGLLSKWDGFFTLFFTSVEKIDKRILFQKTSINPLRSVSGQHFNLLLFFTLFKSKNELKIVISAKTYKSRVSKPGEKGT